MNPIRIDLQRNLERLVAEALPDGDLMMIQLHKILAMSDFLRLF